MAVQVLRSVGNRSGITKRQEDLLQAISIIEQILDYDQLKWCCNASVEDLTAGYKRMGTKDKPCYFKDNGSNILAVAHMDSVCDPLAFLNVDVGDETWVFSSVLDDRAGVYIITHLLPKLGINVDVLLTVDEEIGDSTASEFFTDKKYMWGVEFDRGGDDVVLYDFDNISWATRIKEVGFKVGHGTFSDISSLEEIGCSFMNVGVGSYNGHSKRAYMIVNEMVENLAKFFIFHALYAHKHFPHVYSPKKYKGDGWFYASKGGRLVGWAEESPRVPEAYEYPTVWDNPDWDETDTKWMEGI